MAFGSRAFGASRTSPLQEAGKPGPTPTNVSAEFGGVHRHGDSVFLRS
ncbi:hypothetical protein PoMZ_10021 [Pyricularia oryzae]|uniref:Uncharacterized protein n=1 Tax=Pyricularia oryzae TaxID=318829 RepID=A0A4V1C4W7_PYROR|nr:hypothetical protein PoMZ_10021 [Pyricularia oryzae]